ncbi:MAG: DegT/DnrJ/EryC1/StrS family aminotransferase [Pseudomonadota bacterium]
MRPIPPVDLPAQHAPLEEEILTAVRRVLRHGQFILGPEVRRLEAALEEILGVRHVIGVGNGTDALVLALRAHGVGPGDEVITVSHSFFATTSAITLVGAAPVYVDVDPATMLMDPALLPAARTPRTRAVLPVHLNGHPCDMGRIAAFCQEHGLALVEDCAQALGARWGGRCVGAFGTGCFSLHPLKILGACGDGGAVATDDDALAGWLRRARDLGKLDRDRCGEVSGNSRLDALQAAILGVKLPRLEGWIERRRAHAAAYRAALGGCVEPPPEDPPDGRAVYTFFVVRHPARDRLIGALADRGVDARVHYPIPIHRQPAFSAWPAGPLPHTERTVGEILSLPVTPELSDADRERVIGAVLAACAEAP